MSAAAKIAKEEACGSLVVLGDLFDTTKPLPQIMSEIQKVLSCRTIILEGNHDQVSAAPGDHALGPLSPVAEIVDEPRVFPFGESGHCQLVAIPFQPGDARNWLAKRVSETLCRQPLAEHRTLAIHLGIIDEKTPPYLKGAYDAIPVDLLEQICESQRI